MLGRILFRWRGVIGFIAFGVVFWLARPTFGSCVLALPFLLVGLAVRFWASGYIGIEGRVKEIGASNRLAGGPYRLLRHPLYIGNLLLVVGMLLALRPALWLAVVVLAGFILEYGLIVAAEEMYLAGRRGQKLEARSESADVRIGGRSPQSLVHGPEPFLLSRALVEWRTWIVTGVAWGLAMVRALLVRS